jgi:RNA polymerase sigma-70 factor (ECF subfamily)
VTIKVFKERDLSAATAKFTGPQFLQRLTKQESSAIEDVIGAYSTHLLRACLGMGFAEDHAKEICHATWATFFEVLPRFEGRSHVRTFLFGILYNKVMEHRRSSKKHESYDPIEDAMESDFKEDGHWIRPPQDPHRYSESTEMIEIIEKCLAHLPDTQRMAFTLKVVFEHDTDEVCNEMEISATNLRQLLFRGKARLRKCIDGKYGE